MLANNDLTHGTKTNNILEEQIYINMYNLLNQYKTYWDNCSVILIEKQMGFGAGKQNIMAIKLAQHCYSYFMFMYGNSKTIIEYPATKKTQILGAPKKFGTITKFFKNGKSKDIQDNRKKWSVRTALAILQQRNDTDSYNKLTEDHVYKQQQDDIADCLLMNQAYCFEKFVL